MARCQNAFFIVLVFVNMLPAATLAAELSCDMQRTLVTLAAKARDAGMNATQVTQSLMKADDLTSLEIEAIVETAYVVGRDLPPDTLGKATFNTCKRSMAVRKKDVAKTATLSCYEIGYRYGHTAVRSMNGASVNPEWDFSVPERCKTVKALNEGIRAGSTAAR